MTNYDASGDCQSRRPLAHLEHYTRLRTLVSGFLTHVDLSNRPTTLDR